MSAPRQIPQGATAVPFRFNAGSASDIQGDPSALDVDTGLVEGDFAIYAADPGSNFPALGSPIDSSEYTITERGFGDYDLTINTPDYFTTPGLSSVVVCLDISEGDDIIIAKLYYEVVSSAGGSAGEIADLLAYRHGQGQWGPGYDREASQGSGDPSPSSTIPYGGWNNLWLFDDAATPGLAEYTSFTDLTNNGAEIAVGGGVLGPADSAIMFPTAVIDTLDGAGNGDVSTGDLGVMLVFAGTTDGGPRLYKQSGGGGAGWGAFVNISATPDIIFSLADGSGFTNGSPLGGLTIDGLGDSLARGAILIAALARGTDKARVGVITRAGVVTMSTLADAAALGSLTNAGNWTLSSNDNTTAISALALGFTSMVGVPENLEACLRAVHARLFPVEHAALILEDTDDLETRLTSTRAGYLDNLSGGAVALASALQTVDDFVDDLESRLTAARAGYLDNLDIGEDVASQTQAANIQGTVTDILVDTQELKNVRLTATRAGYLDKLNISGNVASSTEVTSIQNNTRVVRSVPGAIAVPEAGTRTYRIELFLYDETGNMEAPDSAPTIALVNQAGTSRAARLDSATMALISAGYYRAIYTSTAGDTLEQLKWAFTVTEGTIARTYGNDSVTVADGGGGDSAEDIVAALMAHAHDTGVTIGGLFVRQEAWLSGARTIVRVGTTDTFAYLDKDGNIAFTGDLDNETGARGASDVTGSDP